MPSGFQHRGSPDILQRVDSRKTAGEHLPSIPAILAELDAEDTVRHQIALT